MAHAEHDDRERLIDAVGEAHSHGRTLAIVGSGSKSFLLPELEDAGASLLSVAEHAGVIEYRPDELVITARAGTPLRELQQLVARNQQMLPFEPPMFVGGGTLGGAVACGLSGPGRPWWGSVRDSVLGVELINGLGEALSFGGQVMKNVAGYDLSRLQAGAFGTLGVILSVSIKLLPRPPAERTCTLAMWAAESVRCVRAFARQPLPLSATCFDGRFLRIRCSGAEAAVLSACEVIGGEVSERDSYWSHLRDHDLPELRFGDEPWRVSLPPAADVLVDNAVIEWAGALRWVAGASADVAGIAERAGGTAVRLAAGFGQVSGAATPGSLRLYQQRLKASFDPDNLFNPGLVDEHAD
ncbi:MAG: glycolate oxidase subunit GlcE [Gammaproteobacteria bacterium]|nr:glycolate oxidase subunit GlcE [Gammaproteobacteria bacterium]